MGDGFYLAVIKHQCSFQKSFPVSGGAGVYNVCFFRQFGINILDRTDRSRERASVIIAVEGVQQRTVLADQGNFRCGGTCINTQIAVSFICSQISCFYFLGTLTFRKCIVFFLRSEKRFHTFYFKIQLNGIAEPVFHFCQGNGDVFLCI